jgi:hypothetical protein
MYEEATDEPHTAHTLNKVISYIPHHETFSTTIQSPYSYTKGWII